MRTLEEQLVDASLDMGKALLLAGGEVTRVEDTITRILHAYGMHKVGVFTITSLIEVTARTPDGDEIVKARRIAGELGEDVETAFANQKYGFIQGALKETFTPGRREEVTTTAMIDTFVTHKLWGFPIFFALMCAF